MASNKKRDTILIIIGVLLALGLVAGVAFLIATSAERPTDDNEVVESSESVEPTARPSVPDVEQEVVIEQDRTLKFDNINPVQSGIEVGVTELTFDEYVNNVDATASIYRVQAYEATEGFYVKADSIFLHRGASSNIVTTDGFCNITIAEHYNGLGTYETLLSETLDEYGLTEYQALFKMKMDYALTESTDDDPEWSFLSNGSQLLGAEKFDVSRYGYQDCYLILRKLPIGGYVMTCFLKVSEDRCFKIVLADKTDEFFKDYIAELLSNGLVVF